LQSIAQSQWGDASLWYLLADANGLTGSETLTAGMVLNVPSKVANLHNNTGTFKVYDAGKAIGDTGPTLPDPPPANKGCGAVGMILAVLVAAVVTVMTAGAASILMSSTASFTGVGATFSAGLTALTSGNLLIGAVAAAAGSIASQGVLIATGNQEHFSWKQVGLAALGGAVTSFLPTTELMGSIAGHLGLDTVGKAVLNAGVGNLVTQGIGVATGLQDHFSWKGVAASAIAGGVGAKVGMALGNVEGLNPIVAKALTGLAAGVTSAAVRGGSVSRQMAGIVQDVVGSTIGNMIAENLAAPPPTTGSFARLDGDSYRRLPATVEPQIVPDSTRINASQLDGLRDMPLYATIDPSDAADLDGLYDVLHGPIVDNWSRLAMGYGEDPDAPTTTKLLSTLDGSDSGAKPAMRVAVKGDSWAKIAREQYGDERYWQALARRNGATGTFLATGQEVILPDLTGTNLRQGGASIAEEYAAGIRADLAATKKYLDRNDNALRSSITEQFDLARKAVPTPLGRPVSSETFTATYDSVVIANWKQFMKETNENLDQVGVSGGGNAMTAAAAAAHAGSEIGFRLVDAGFGLGRVAARTYDSYSRGTLWTDFNANVIDPTISFAAAMAKTDTYRLSLGVTLKNDDDVKIMIGTDRFGIQYKAGGIADSVNRYTYRWGDPSWTDEMLLEKNFKYGTHNRLLPSMQIGGVPLSIDVVPGARQNLTGNRTITPSMNIDFNIGKTDYIPLKFKLSIEFRKSGS
jgi:hypothetical protein